MKPLLRISMVLLISSPFLTPLLAASSDLWQMRIIPIFMTVAGLGIISIWTVDLLKKEKVSLDEGLLYIRDRETGQYILPHLLAEYGTALLLLIAAVGLCRSTSWATRLSFLALGALIYTSLNSLSWVVTRRERLPYGIPMLFALAGALVSIILLF